MAQFMEAIDRRNVAGRMQVLEHLCTSLEPRFASEFPVWHAEELRKTDERVAAGEYEFMSLEKSSRRFAEMAYAH